MKKRILALLLCLLLITPSLAVAAMAEENTVKIYTAEDLQKLSERCVSDTWSAGKTILLENDINLTGTSFKPIPLMAGVFDGQGHSIVGFKFDADGSAQGFFRCVLPSGMVKRLKVSGTINATGNGENIGGIVGVNLGRLSNCSFDGDIHGIGAVGGVVGLNCESGYLSYCASTGEINGEHRIGGVVGENRGSIEKCSNSAAINTEHFVVDSQTSFDISSLSINTETLVDIADIGGVAGLNSGTLSTCTNTGSIGYPHVGYNIGGVAGRQNGRIYNCTNRGEIVGRKDVGGIAGQIEPHSKRDNSSAALGQLQSQLYSLEAALNNMLGNVAATMGEARILLGSAAEIVRNSGDIVGSMRTTTSSSGYTPQLQPQTQPDTQPASAPAVEQPVAQTLSAVTYAEPAPGEGGTGDAGSGDTGSGDTGSGGIDLPNLPDIGGVNPGDWGSQNGDQMNALISNFQDLAQIMAALNDAVNGEALVYDMQVVAAQFMNVSSTMVNMIYDLMNSATASPEVMDISDSENEDEALCVVARCTNLGEINADTNVGGIAGAVALDIAFDREDTLGVSSFVMGSRAYEVYARILECENYATIMAEKSYAGGIAGRMDYGLVIDSAAAGDVEAVESYVGGIAGYSTGSIRSCAARVNLAATSYVGGIAGLGKNIADCRAMPHIEDYAEFMGSVAGYANGEGTVENNYYADSTIGGVDGFSFAGQSEYMDYDRFVALKSTPNTFKSITVTFVADGRPVQAVEVPFGGSVERLPAIEDKDGMYWQWDSFNNEHIYYSITVEGEYVRPVTTIATDEEEPLFLAEGVFRDNQQLKAVPFAPDVKALGLDDDEDKPVQGYTVQVSDYTDKLTVRMLMPDSGKLYELKDGVLTPIDYTRERSYIVFDLDNGASIVWQTHEEISRTGAIIGIAAVVVVAAGVTVLLLTRKKKKAEVETTAQEE